IAAILWMCDHLQVTRFPYTTLFRSMLPLSSRLLRSTFVALSLLSLGACCMFSSKDPRYEPAELTQYEAQVSAGVRWTASIGGGGGAGLAPGVVGEADYAAPPNAVAEVDAMPGRLVSRDTPGVATT